MDAVLAGEVDSNVKMMVKLAEESCNDGMIQSINQSIEHHLLMFVIVQFIKSSNQSINNADCSLFSLKWNVFSL